MSFSLPCLTTLLLVVRTSYRVAQSPEIFLLVGEAASLRKYVYRKEMEVGTRRLARVKEVASNAEAVTGAFLHLSAFPNGSGHIGKLEKCLRRSRGHAEPRSAKENRLGSIVC